MTPLDSALNSVRLLVCASGQLGVNISVCCDGRVSIEVLKDSMRTKLGHADLHPEGSPLPKPSEMLLKLVDDARKAWP